MVSIHDVQLYALVLEIGQLITKKELDKMIEGFPKFPQIYLKN